MKGKIDMNRTIRRISIGTAFLAAAFLFAACGGGSSGGSSSSTSTRGTITGFGSVFVDGHEFRTSTGTHRKNLDEGMNDMSGHDNEVFRIGMVVTVIHDGDDASEIEYENELEGPIADLDNVLKRFTVLGQPVAYDNVMTFEPHGMTPANGMVVEVSGTVDSTGLLHASFIETKPGMMSFEIKGYVSSLDNNLKTFKLGLVPGAAAATITVDYSSASLSDLPGGALSNGLFVEVKTTATGLVGGKLPATSVEGHEDIGHSDDMLKS